MFGVLLVVAEAEFGFVPAFLREFRTFIEEGWIVDLAHYVHLLSKTKSTVLLPLMYRKAFSSISHFSVGSVPSCLSQMW